MEPIEEGKKFRQEQWERFRESYNDPKWFETRSRILDRDKKCHICGSVEHFEVHHIYYKFNGSLAWEYPDDALRTLCSKCHKELHRIKRESFIKLTDEEAIGIMDTLFIWDQDNAFTEEQLIKMYSDLAEEYFKRIEQEKKEGKSATWLKIEGNKE